MVADIGHTQRRHRLRHQRRIKFHRVEHQRDLMPVDGPPIGQPEDTITDCEIAAYGYDVTSLHQCGLRFLI